MKNPTDRIGDPDESAWRAEGFDAREVFLLRCLNAAVNLHGVLSYGEFRDIYNRYAPDHDAPVSEPLGEDELDGFLARVAACEEGDGSEIDALLDAFGCCFTAGCDFRTGERLIARVSLADAAAGADVADPPPTDEELDRLVSERLAAARDHFREIDYPPLDEETFLEFESLDDADEDGADEGDAGDEDGDALDEEAGEPIKIEELPPAQDTGPIDFKFVKDAAKREQVLYDYEGVRIVTQEFVRHVVMKELTPNERRDAARRLGLDIDSETGFLLDPRQDMVAGDFAAMMDDQHGEPAIRRILKRTAELDDYDRAAAAYFANYRYAWLEVLSVKAGVGVRCRNLLTGEELFLMETRFSRGDVKGRTVCAGIAPMGGVYLAFGMLLTAHFEHPATILKIVLAHLGLPSGLPVRLSFADQARFAAETIRRLNANGRLGRPVED